MDLNTKKRFLTQMLANVEQLVQSSEDAGMHTQTIMQYRTYVLQELKNSYDEISSEEAETDDRGTE